MKPTRLTRALLLAAVTIVVAGVLSGCQSGPSPTSPRALAQAATKAWTRDAVHAVASPAPKTITKSDAFEICRTDHGYFTTSSQWRRITDISVPLSRQAAATAAIRRAFEADSWAASRSAGITTLVGPVGAKGKGLITVQTAGESQLVVVVISPCYAG